MLSTSFLRSVPALLRRFLCSSLAVRCCSSPRPRSLQLPSYLARHTIPVLGTVVDPSAAVLVLAVTVLLCMGIKESSLAQAIVTTVNICGMLFIIIVGGYLAFKTGWIGYELPSGYFPLGLNGMLGGSAVVFFSFIGFDVVASTAEEKDAGCLNS
ncbi:cationic amino acid transporter 4, vacuolar-like isoform X1 [Manihot esculenta]|uniref:cationic amino acid transporter 4, vacuolar-like isoform X1 n=1 Tax=Manihot esculenta TaxID=3983 RepID=UPI001CC51B08|nr:cationic amino acid transporter 4, vacuolar-like isoform X1 [Manihot esculenta]